MVVRHVLNVFVRTFGYSAGVGEGTNVVGFTIVIPCDDLLPNAGVSMDQFRLP